MKNLIRIFLIVVIVGASISIGSSCSDENDCSLAGRPMMYCTLYTIDEITDRRVNDTLDSLTITALGTDSIILNNQKKVHTLMLPLRYTSDTTVFILWYNPNSPTNKKDVDTLYIIQKNTPYFQSMECGYMMKQNILSTKFGNTKNSSERIDSLHIQNKEANTNEIENLQIFYRYRDRTPPTIESCAAPLLYWITVNCTTATTTTGSCTEKRPEEERGCSRYYPVL